MCENIKKFFKGLWKAMSFDYILSWWMLVLTYLIMVLPFYLFYYFVNKDFFTLSGQISFLKTVVWIPLIFYSEIVILAYIRYSRRKDEQKEYPFKKTVMNIKELIVKVFKNDIHSLKIEWYQVTWLFLGYAITSFLLYRLVEDFYIGNMVKIGILYIVLLIIKILMLFSILDLFTITKSSRNKFFFLMSGIVLSDLWIALARLFFENSLEISTIKQKLGIYLSTFLSLNPPTLIGIFVAIGIFIIQTRSNKIKTEAEDNFSLGIGILFMFLFSLCFAFLSLSAFASPNIESFAVSSAKVGYLSKEFMILLGLCFLFSKFLLNLSEIIKNSELADKTLIKIEGKVIGYATYSHIKNIYQNYSYNKSQNFLIVKSDSEEFLISEPKRNAVFSLKNNLFVADEIEVYGYYMTAQDLNSEKRKKIKFFVPLIVRLKKPSLIRKFSI